MKTLLRKHFSGSLKGILLFGPALLLVVAVLNIGDIMGWVVVAISVVLLVVITFGSGISIKANENVVVIGLFPFFRKRLSRDSIVRIYADEVRPFEDFGGWGVKGNARKNGLLLSTGETEVIGFELSDGRRYFVAAGDETQKVIALLGAATSR